MNEGGYMLQIPAVGRSGRNGGVRWASRMGFCRSGVWTLAAGNNYSGMQDMRWSSDAAGNEISICSISTEIGRSELLQSSRNILNRDYNPNDTDKGYSSLSKLLGGTMSQNVLESCGECSSQRSIGSDAIENPTLICNSTGKIGILGFSNSSKIHFLKSKEHGHEKPDIMLSRRLARLKPIVNCGTGGHGTSINSDAQEKVWSRAFCETGIGTANSQFSANSTISPQLGNKTRRQQHSQYSVLNHKYKPKHRFETCASIGRMHSNSSYPSEGCSKQDPASCEKIHVCSLANNAVVRCQNHVKENCRKFVGSTEHLSCAHQHGLCCEENAYDLQDPTAFSVLTVNGHLRDTYTADASHDPYGQMKLGEISKLSHLAGQHEILWLNKNSSTNFMSLLPLAAHGSYKKILSRQYYGCKNGSTCADREHVTGDPSLGVLSFIESEQKVHSLSDADKADLVSVASSAETKQASPISVLEPPSDVFANSGCVNQACAHLHELQMQLGVELVKFAIECPDISVSAVYSNEEILKVVDDIKIEFGDDEERDFTYLLDILIASSIHGIDPSQLQKVCHSQELPVSPGVFKMLDNKYAKLKNWLRSDRRLLFDLVNSILSVVLSPCLDLHPWASSNRMVGPVWGPEGLLEKVSLISTRLSQELPLGDPKEKVLDGHFWPDLADAIDRVGRDIERMIKDELLDELVAELSSCSC